MAKSLGAVVALIGIDLSAAGICMALGYLVRDQLLHALFPSTFPTRLIEATFEHIWWYPLMVIFFIVQEKLYQRRMPYWVEVGRLVKACTLAFLSVVAILYISKVGEEVSRFLLIIIWLCTLLVVPGLRYYGKLLLTRLRVWNRKLVLVGDGELAAITVKALARESIMGYELIGYIGEAETEKNPAWKGQKAPAELKGLKQFGSIENLDHLDLKGNPAKDAIIALSGPGSERLNPLIDKLHPLFDNIYLVPDIQGMPLSGLETAFFFEEQIFTLRVKNLYKSLHNRAGKQLFDLSIGLLFSLLTMPLLFACSLLIKLDSAGPVFFRQVRIGQDGKEFTCYKFRSMYTHSDELLDAYLLSDASACREWNEYRKLKSHDPRLTRIGKLLRRYSLDELPQIINILRGEMSLVGPRPYMPCEKELLGRWAQDIQSCKPGLTGLWQVSGRNRLSFKTRLRLDSWYIKNWSLWMDIVILLKTPRVVYKKDGAY